MFYSAKNNVFYSREFHGDGIPDDAVPITAGQHAELLKGQSEGKVIAPDENGHPALIDPPPSVPQVPKQVTNAQGAAALIQAGLWQPVLDYVDSMGDPTEKALAEVALHRTAHWQRSSPFLNGAADALGMTGEQLDDLFIAAAEIQL